MGILDNKHSNLWIVNIGLLTMDSKTLESHTDCYQWTYKESIEEIRRIKPMDSHIIEACRSRCVGITMLHGRGGGCRHVCGCSNNNTRNYSDGDPLTRQSRNKMLLDSSGVAGCNTAVIFQLGKCDNFDASSPSLCFRKKINCVDVNKNNANIFHYETHALCYDNIYLALCQ